MCSFSSTREIAPSFWNGLSREKLISALSRLMLMRINFDNVCLPIEPPISRTLAIAYKSKDNLPIASKHFIDYLMEHKAELP